MNNKDFEKLSPKDALEKAGVSLENGLSSEEVQKRQKEYGLNEVPEKEVSTFQQIIKRFWGPIPWMIETAAILSAIIQKWEDFTIIIILLFINVFIDYRQEISALKALKILKKKLAHTALVIRNGQWQEIVAKDLVFGDIIKLKIGSIIPADVKLLQAKYLQVDQSALTGESFPVEKTVGEISLGNSIVKLGEMIALVTSTGLNTYFGKTVTLVAQAEKQQRSHFQKAVIKIGYYLIKISFVMILCILAMGIYRQESWLEILQFTMVLSVASIPVALPAVLSVTMAVGALKLAKKKAIVNRLASIEELAGVNILCCDKTGTLTKNQMELAQPISYTNRKN